MNRQAVGDAMFERFPRLDILWALCRTRLRVMLISLTTFAAAAVALWLVYLRLSGEMAERIPSTFATIPHADRRLEPLLQILGQDIVEVSLTELRAIGIVALVFLALLYLMADVGMLLFSFVVEALLLPRKERVREYLRARNEFERRAMPWLILIATVLCVALGWWAAGSIEQSDFAGRALSILPSLIIVMTAVVFTLDYILQVKWGLLSYLKSSHLGASDLTRVLSAQFLHTAAICTFAWIAFVAVELGGGIWGQALLS